MKKTYINPTMKVVKIHIRQMLASSPGVTLNRDGSVDAASVEGRYFDFDFDDDEE